MNIGNYYSSYYSTLLGGLGGKNNALNSLSSIGSIYSASKTASENYLNSIFNKQNGLGTVDEGALGFVRSLKSGAAELNGALKALSGGSAFRQTGAVSSDTEAMTVSSAAGSSFSKDKAVRIDQIATGQVNEGSALQAEGKAGYSPGNQFSVEVGGKTHTFNINVLSGDTNKDVQQKMANAINQRGIGLEASVSVNASDKTSTLSIKAVGTGDDNKNKFTISDIRGNAVAKTGADKITQEAADALYSINGGETKSSKTNSVNLGDGVTATLKKASEAEIKVSYGKDSEFAVDKIKQLAEGYNKLYSAAVENGGNTKTDRLFSRLVSTSTTYAGSLAKVGIGFDKDGKMTVDTEKATAAAKDGSLESLFTQDSGKNYGYANQLGRIADSVTTNTAMYVDKNSFRNSIMDTLGYSGTGALLTNSLPYAGLLFDFRL